MNSSEIKCVVFFFWSNIKKHEIFSSWKVSKTTDNNEWCKKKKRLKPKPWRLQHKISSEWLFLLWIYVQRIFLEAVRVCDLRPLMLLLSAVAIAPGCFPALTPALTSFVSKHRLPWFLQFLHRRDVSGGAWAAGDGAELCVCFWHGSQEANEEVVGHANDELHQPTGGWDPLLWLAHLHQTPRPRQRAVLCPRAVQCHGQCRASLV